MTSIAGFEFERHTFYAGLAWESERMPANDEKIKPLAKSEILHQPICDSLGVNPSATAKASPSLLRENRLPITKPVVMRTSLLW